MKEYEIMCKYINACGGKDYPVITFDEAELADPDDYVRGKHGRYFDQFVKEVLPSGQIRYTWDSGVCYIYELTEV